MKINQLLVIFLGIFISQNLFAQGINFEHGSFEELKTKAKKENKLIFVDAYTTWCGPCKWMSSVVFTNDTVGNFYNKQFVSAKIDMEKGEGIEFAKKYNVRCYPNLIILNADGEVIHRLGGGMKPTDFIHFGETALQGAKTFSYYQSNYEKSKTDLTFLKEYIDYLGHTCLPMDEQINSYFSLLDSTNYTEQNNWNMIYDYANSIDSKPFQYLIHHQDAFKKKYTNDSVDLKIISVFKKNANKYLFAKTPNEQELNKYLLDILAIKIPQTPIAAFSIQLNFWVKTNQWERFEKELIEKGDELVHPSSYNEIAWDIYEKSTNEKLLKKAASWMQNLINNQGDNANNYAELDTYASILFKLKQKNEALNIANKAIEKAKKMGMKEEQYEETKELITKINAL
jgi:thiol-disulfide isomerase/thioredoxin